MQSQGKPGAQRRVKQDGKRGHRRDPIASLFGAEREAAKTPTCAHPDCSAPGTHRAPLSRQRLREYQYLCLAHVREFNAHWNYYANMTPGEIEQHRLHDLLGERPTWPLGKGPSLRAAGTKKPGMTGGYAEALRDLLGDFQDKPTPRRRTRLASIRRLTPAQQRACTLLDLPDTFTHAQLRRAFKQQAKAVHPDHNPNTPNANAAFHAIKRAYEVLRVAAR